MKRLVGALLCLNLILSVSTSVFANSEADDGWLASTEGDYLVKAIPTAPLVAGQKGPETNQLMLTFQSIAGQPVSLLEFTATDFVPFMPTMGHGTVATHQVDLGFGEENQALVKQIYFTMATMAAHGWVIYLDVNLDGLSNRFEIPVIVGM
ncbi:hypothetical protein [Pseudobacteriovorax antillogorgiicola]|uniref:YtkA-like n=1 Tax=Pseudobacteriovorax antillogorgiicola TaxID=1513793 RepID=A0A1Y6BH71_9BACT|nr:hypothetical protein [Pseudobacteriovorax antillogorgiicola]TCS56186.1 hypothetical protein EDD56_1048 [Pseudobacteriovorax antillogorgiicola]SMF08893.1 hypothetical protein SAMN06296036_104326 [Pseudobacteriovorax antillogorgiicola]